MELESETKPSEVNIEKDNKTDSTEKSTAGTFESFSDLSGDSETRKIKSLTPSTVEIKQESSVVRREVVLSTADVVISCISLQTRSRLPNEIISGLPLCNDLRDTELCHEMSKFEVEIKRNISANLVVEKITDLLLEKFTVPGPIDSQGQTEKYFRLFKRIMKDFFWVHTSFQWNSVLLCLVVTQRCVSRLVDPLLTQTVDENLVLLLINCCIKLLDEPGIQLAIKDLGGWEALAISYDYVVTTPEPTKPAQQVLNETCRTKFTASSYNINGRLANVKKNINLDIM